MTPGSSLTGKIQFARLVLAWEVFWRLFWPVPAWIALILAIALLDLLPLLAPFWHEASLALWLIGLLALLTRLRHFRIPTQDQCRRRLEQDSGLAHRPLSQWEDRPADFDDQGVAAALWRLQRQKLQRLIGRLRLRPPAPGLPARDPLGLRFAPLLLLAIALAAGRHDPGARLDRALDPGFDPAAPPPVLQIWLTPPSYTGQSPQMLTVGASDRTIPIPLGSKLLAELQGSDRDAGLFIDDRKLPFTRLDAQSQKLETDLTEGQSLSVRLGRRLVARWKIEIIPDHPPEVAFTAPPTGLIDGRLQIHVKAQDDYAVDQLSLVLRREDLADSETDVRLPGGGQKEISLDQILDLTSHPWSGLRVAMHPVAVDGAGQEGRGAEIRLVLPERQFRHPVARAIAEQRRALAQSDDQLPSVVEHLASLAGQPDRFNGDTTVFLQLVTAHWRLLRDHGPTAIPSVLDMLWAAALRVEQGDVQDSRDAVDQASQALADALAKGAGDAEISQLTENLNNAMQRLIASLAKQGAAQKGASGPANGKTMTPAEVQAMFDRMSDLAHAGARQAAQQSLRALRDLLDRLSFGGDSAPGDQQQLTDSLDGLQRLMQEERSLLDRSFQRSTQSGNAKTGADSDRQNQQSLRGQLEKMLRSMPDAAHLAPALGQAAQAMERAEQALQGDHLGPAQDAEGEALTKLQEGARQIGAAIGQGQAAGSGQGADNVKNAPGRDPLGRSLPGGQAVDDGNVKIPAQSELGKSREILDELRRRAGDAERSPAERDYLHRLLDRLY